MVATPAKKELWDSNTFQVNDKLRLLRSAAIYGANASGKSNLTKAMVFMRNFIQNSSKDLQTGEVIPVNAFRLSSNTENMPSFFEIVFMLAGACYRYGFSVDRQMVHNEWLHCIPDGKNKELDLFVREKKEFIISSNFIEGKDLKDRTRDNALFLSVVAQFNGAISGKILKWLTSLNIISGLTDAGIQDFSFSCLGDPMLQEKITELLSNADLGIDRVDQGFAPINFNKLPPDMPDNVKKTLLEKGIPTVFTTHKKYNSAGDVVGAERFNLYENESEGTKKMFALAGPIIDTLKYGKILVVDEFDARFHPLLNHFLVKLFNSPGTNKLNAQLIFSSHNTQCLHRSFLRRDQVWFAEKDQFGATDLYSLEDFKVRKDASYDKDYIAGKYGAIPLIGDPGELFGDE
jgi:hypothetical protein